MGFFDEWIFRLQSLGRRERFEDDLDEELRFHLEMEIEQHMAQGLSRREAERQARLDFGAPESVKEACRDAWGTRLVDDAVRDLKGALRGLAKAPVFTGAVLGSLVLGLGATTVVFSLVDAVLLRPLSFDQPDRILRFYELTENGSPFSASDANLVDFRARSTHLGHIAAVNFPSPRPAFGQDGNRVQVRAEAVTANFFEVFGTDAARGRLFSSEDAERKERVAVLTHFGWTRLFGSDPDVVDQTVDLDGKAWTLIGVLPESFRWSDGQDHFFLPYRLDPAGINRGDHRLTAYARLAPGSELGQAQEQVAAIAADLGRTYPESNADWGARLVPIETDMFGPEIRRTNGLLLGAVLLLLLLACVNVSNLMLVRAEDRAHELQLRRALGAGKGRLWRQVWTESLLLGVLGAAGAAILAAATLPWVRRLDVDLPRLDQMTLDLRTLAFLVAATLVGCLIFGTAAAWRAERGASRAVHRARRHGDDRAGVRLRNGLVIAEVALATVLALGAGVLWRSFDKLQGVDSGFEDQGVLMAEIELPDERYPESSRATITFYDQLIERLQALPDVEAVAATTTSPFDGPQLQNYVAPAWETEQEEFEPIHWRAVTSDYFRAMGIPMLLGTSLSSGGRPGREMVLSANLAERLWPAQDPVGKKIRWIGPKGPEATVVGVVGDVQDLELGEAPLPMVYLPQRGMGWAQMTMLIKTAGPSAPLAEALRGAVRELDPLLAVPEVSSLRAQRTEALARPLFSLRLVAFSAGLALLLALVGIYGMVAYGISRRRRELGLRLAIGARPGQVVTLVAGDGLRLTLAGLGCGLVLAFGLLDTLRSMLYETSPLDPGVTAVVLTGLAAVGFLAGLLPALRAAAVDPITTLRPE